MFPRTAVFAAVASTALALPAFAGATTASLKVERAWARPAPAGLPSSAAYFTVRNTGNTPDELVGVSSPIAKASLHESMDHGGMMMMQPVASIPVAPGGRIDLKPGGLHVMLEGLKRPLKPGDRLPVTLTFKRAGNVIVRAEVRTAAP